MIKGNLAKDSITAIVALVLLVWVLPLLISINTLTVLIVYGLLGLSLGLIWGFGGILCFGQAAFFGLGAYTYAIAAINIGESTLPMILAIVVPASFAALLGAMMFYGQLNDVYLGVVTLVVTLILFKFINSTAGPQYVIGTARLGGFNGIPGFPILNVPGFRDVYIWGTPYFYACAVILTVVFVLVSVLLRSSFGRIAVGIRENETRMALLGYNVAARKTSMFTIGAAIAGLAGAMFANWSEIVTPNLFSLSQTAEIIIWCIVGGLGTRLGPVIGAAGLSYLKFLLGQQTIIDNTMIAGIILIFFVIFLPKGLVPEIAGVWTASFKRRPFGQIARRRRRRARSRSDG